MYKTLSTPMPPTGYMKGKKKLKKEKQMLASTHHPPPDMNIMESSKMKGNHKNIMVLEAQTRREC